MIGTLVVAVLILVASLAVGRALMMALGWKRPDWIGGAVGFAALVVVAPFAVRLPGRGLTAAILIALLTVACIVATRRSVPPGPAAGEPRRGGHLVALVVTVAVLAAACLPFLFNEEMGVLGEGIYTNDQAAQLYWADWLANGIGPQPNAVAFGYPVGPQALAASVSAGTGIDLIAVFNGLLIAIPALTALAALSALAILPPWRRALAAILTGMPYLGASFLAQSGFKETAMALFLIGLAVALHLAQRRPQDTAAPEPPPAHAVVAVVVILGAATVFTFSIPGGAWFAITIPLWAILAWAFGTMKLDLSAARAWAGDHRGALLAGGLVCVAIAAVVLGPASAFVSRIGDVQESSGRLSSPVWPGEALGIWPEGDFRIVRGEVSGALIATGFAALCTLGGVVALFRRREWALLSALIAAAFIYLLSRPIAQIHVEAKALAVLAPIAMLVTVRWLLGQNTSGGMLRSARRKPRPALLSRLVRAASAGSGRVAARQAVGALFCIAALASTFLALRAAPVGFDERGRDLETLANRAQGERLVFLGIDRFAGYWLRGTLIRSPGGYVPPDVSSRASKTWQQGLAVDFDNLEPSRLEDFRFAITTAAGYQSTPPPSFTEVARRGDYVLWKRKGDVARTNVLPDESGDPGAELACGTEDADAVLARGGSALVLEEPVVGEHDEWQLEPAFDAPGIATQELAASPGRFALSLQYHSQVPLTVRVDGEVVAEMPPSLEGFYLVGAGRGAFWPAGIGHADGRAVKVEVEAQEASSFQRTLGVKRKVWLGSVALTSTQPPAVMPLADACGEYVDRYLPTGKGGPGALVTTPEP